MIIRPISYLLIKKRGWRKTFSQIFQYQQLLSNVSNTSESPRSLNTDGWMVMSLDTDIVFWLIHSHASRLKKEVRNFSIASIRRCQPYSIAHLLLNLMVRTVWQFDFIPIINKFQRTAFWYVLFISTPDIPLFATCFFL